MISKIKFLPLAAIFVSLSAHSFEVPVLKVQDRAERGLDKVFSKMDISKEVLTKKRDVAEQVQSTPVMANKAVKGLASAGVVDASRVSSSTGGTAIQRGVVSGGYCVGERLGMDAKGKVLSCQSGEWGGSSKVSGEVMAYRDVRPGNFAPDRSFERGFNPYPVVCKIHGYDADYNGGCTSWAGTTKKQWVYVNTSGTRQYFKYKSDGNKRSICSAVRCRKMGKFDQDKFYMINGAIHSE